MCMCAKIVRTSKKKKEKPRFSPVFFPERVIVFFSIFFSFNQKKPQGEAAVMLGWYKEDAACVCCLRCMQLFSFSIFYLFCEAFWYLFFKVRASCYLLTAKYILEKKKDTLVVLFSLFVCILFVYSAWLHAFNRLFFFPFFFPQRATTRDHQHLKSSRVYHCLSSSLFFCFTGQFLMLDEN